MGFQNGFTGPRRLLWLFDKALKPNSLYLFNEKQIGVQRPIFYPNLGLQLLGMGSESQIWDEVNPKVFLVHW